MIESRFHSLRAGFTLTELLVAIAVLAIILVAGAKILGTTAVLTTVNNKHMDANDQARAVFDCMADDFARMIKRKDVDYIFWKNTPSATAANDAMYFYTEGASYFDGNTFTSTSAFGYPYPELDKNSVSLVGYRVNNTTTTGFVAPYYQLERLGKALSWDGQAYNSGSGSNQNASAQPHVEVLLTYPPTGTDVHTLGAPDNTVAYSAALFNSTIAGAFSNNTTLGRVLNTTKGSTVGTEAKAFNDSADTCYRTVGSQVFRFEYSFQLKDGTLSDKPVMVASATNGVPSSNIAGIQRPLPTNGSPTYSIGSRWWDTTNHIGYICLDATPSYAVWHEIGVQDVAAIIVTIAVIDRQGLTFVNAKAGDLSKIAAKLADYTNGSDPGYLLDPTQSTGWAYALLPGKAVSTTNIVGSTKLPQSMIAQIRLYQRYFYLNVY